MSAARLTAALLLAASAARAQDCHPGKNSNEAKLLAFYSVPVAFSPQLVGPGADNAPRFFVGADAAYVPTPDAALRITSECFIPKDHTTHLTSIFPRPRIGVRLPFGLFGEASYLPPVRIAGAKAHVFSAALSGEAMVFPGDAGVAVVTRLHGTVGTIQGAITCSRAALRPDDPADPCFGTQPSEDTFHPNMLAGEAIVARRFARRGELYLGAGTTWLRPRFQVGFRDGFGGLEDTRLVVNLNRTNVFGGGAVRLAERWLVTGQVYTAFSDATVARVGVAWEGKGAARE
ncbi:MAG TPA: hypothetical protein VHM67_07085 [Gemmatimonadaceae bacterium]|nr:hypothetical protein [Gemmatimonadaceae bacterium]